MGFLGHKNSKDEKFGDLKLFKKKTEVGKLFTKWGSGKLSSGTSDEEMRDDM